MRPVPPAPVTSALRHWRQRRSQGSANDTAAPARLASSPVPRKRREEPRPPQRFFQSSGYAKTAHSLRFHKNPCSGSQVSRPVRVRTRQHEKLSARFACWRQNKTYGGWHQWPDGAGQHVHNTIMQSVASLLHGVPCCIIVHYVKSGFGEPPYLWRLLQTAQNGAWQPGSHAPTGYAGCLTAAPRISAIVTPQSRPSSQALSTAPACVRSGLSRFLQAKRACRASPPLLASRCSTVIRCYRKSGKSPCRSTGKANIQVVASGFVTLLARENRASSPPKPCHPQSQRYTRSVMPLANKQQAPRQPERKHAKQGGWATTTLLHTPIHSIGPTPLLAKEQQGRSTAPAARSQPLRG